MAGHYRPARMETAGARGRGNDDQGSEGKTGGSTHQSAALTHVH